MDGPELARLHVVRARLQAEADMAAERRMERRRLRLGKRGPVVRGRDFVVDDRRRRPLPRRPAPSIPEGQR